MKPEVIEREVINADDDVAQMVAPLEQRVFLGRDDAERERRLCDVAHVRVRIAGELAVLFRRPDLGFDRLGVDRRLQGEFNSADGLGFEHRHVGLGGQAVTRGRRCDQQLGDLMTDFVRRHVVRMAEREDGAVEEGNVYVEDDGVRTDSSMEGLAKLKPFFDKKYGRITPGNSSQITDGAAWLILASEQAVDKLGLEPLGKISDSQWAGLDPAQMGLGPVHAVTPILQRHGLGLNDIDAWEINEAFAAQVLGCLAAWESDDYCREQLGLPGALGKLDEDRLNVDGGAVALGHPVGASGARIVLHTLHVLRERQAKRGIASICIGGGLGGAMLVETVD